MIVRIFETAVAAGLVATMAGAAPVDFPKDDAAGIIAQGVRNRPSAPDKSTINSSDSLFDTFLSAVSQHDFARAKAIMAEIEHRKVRFFELKKGETIEALDACIAAGHPLLTPAERKAIDAAPSNNDNFAPNDEMKAAVAFANGWGVPRDPKRAIASLCHADDLAEAEWIIMVHAVSTPKRSDKPFLFCDHTTSGMNGSQCESFVQDKNKVVRDQKLAKLTAAFTAEQKRIYTKLLQTATSYIDGHASDEQDMSGTLRGAFYADEVSAMEQELYEALDGFEQGKRPVTNDLAAADAELNTLYRSILKDTDWTLSGTVKPEGLRATERLWLNYRDAWVAFGTLRYPATNADDWKAWATRARIATLQKAFSR